jgi:Big-like domain-containing protein
MSRMTGATYGFGPGLLLAAAALLSACGGGGSGDTTGPPPGGADQVDTLVLEVDSMDVPVDDTVRIHAEARDAHGEVVQGIQLTFTSSDPAVATVSDDGLVTAVDLGVAEIEVGIAEAASIGLDSRSATVMSAALVAGKRRGFTVVVMPRVVIIPDEQSLDAGATSQYSAILTKAKGQPAGLPSTTTWSSSNLSVATVDKNSGLATAVAEGDTWITAIVAVGIARYSSRAVLHVGLCGGILKVAGWNALVDVEYKASGTDQRAQAKYVVDQSSTSLVSLARSDDWSPDSVRWEGVVTADIRLGNSVTFPVGQGKTGVTKEVNSAKQQTGPGALAVLKVRRPAEGSYACTYSFQYTDAFNWTVTNNQGAPPILRQGPTGSALHFGAAVGARPATGPWVLGDKEKPVKVPGRTFAGPDGLARSAYTPTTYLGILIITALGKAPDPSYGQASFLYQLTATQ